MSWYRANPSSAGLVLPEVGQCCSVLDHFCKQFEAKTAYHQVRRKIMKTESSDGDPVSQGIEFTWDLGVISNSFRQEVNSSDLDAIALGSLGRGQFLIYLSSGYVLAGIKFKLFLLKRSREDASQCPLIKKLQYVKMLNSMYVLLTAPGNFSMECSRTTLEKGLLLCWSRNIIRIFPRVLLQLSNCFHIYKLW